MDKLSKFKIVLITILDRLSSSFLVIPLRIQKRKMLAIYKISAG